MAAMAIPDVDAHGSLSRGVVRLRMQNPPAALSSFDAADRIVVETMSAGGSAGTPAPNAILSRRLRDAFDPGRIFNRGILGDEAT
jgi:FAD/FMN-containing dehydrogenase